MQQDLIRHLDEAVTEVFGVMLNLSCTAEPEQVAAANPLDRPPYFNASVLFSGRLQGRCCLQFDEQTAAKLTSNLMGISGCEISRDLCADTAGELCNMIAGCWKKRHPQDLAASLLSCPIVTQGQCQHGIDNNREDVTLLYHLDGHRLTLRLAFNYSNSPDQTHKRVRGNPRTPSSSIP